MFVSYLVHMLIAIGSNSSQGYHPEYTLTCVNAYVSQILSTKKRHNQPTEAVFSDNVSSGYMMEAKYSSGSRGRVRGVQTPFIDLTLVSD